MRNSDKGEEYKVGDLIYDPGIYDAMNTDTSDLHFYKRWLPKKKDARILELCCGSGRLTIPIALEGYDITGVDYTTTMIEEAKRKASIAAVDIQFIQGDMRTLDDLSKRYDLVFIPFNSIHHLYNNEDLFNTLKVVQKHLKDDGSFLFDCFSPSIHYIVEGEKALQTIAKYTTKDGREIEIKQVMKYEKSSQINRIDWHYFIDGQFDSIQKLDMRMFYPQELDSYIAQSGFQIIHKFGSFDEEPFGADSDKQIFVCG